MIIIKREFLDDEKEDKIEQKLEKEVTVNFNHGSYVYILFLGVVEERR